MNIEFLREFLIAAKESNFTTAARMAHITQPTLSRHIEAIEKEIGVQLFERSPYGVTPTSEGRLLYEHAVDILANYDNAIAEVQSIGRDHPQKVLIGGNFRDDRVMMLAYSAAMRLHRSDEPIEVILNTHHASPDHLELSSHDVLDAIARGESDIVLVLSHASSTWEDSLHVTKICKSPLAAVASKRHALANQTNLSIADVAQYPLVRLPIHGSFGDGIRMLYEQEGFKPEERIHMYSNELDMFSCHNDEEILWLPESTADRIPAAGIFDMVRLSIQDENAFLYIWAVYQLGNDAIERVVQVLQEIPSELRYE